jgi:hypothetical protein
MRKLARILTGSTALSAVVFMIVLTIGCSPGKPPLGPNEVRISTSKIIESDSMIVIRILVEFLGERRVFMRDGGGVDEAMAGPEDPRTDDHAQAEITLAAVLPTIPETGSKTFTWLARIQTPGVTVGGPLHMGVPADKTLADLISIDVEPANYAIGETIPIGKVQGRDLTLTVR